MGLVKPLRKSRNPVPASTLEVEFALVLSRMIDLVKKDPQHLRETLYELARYKLQREFSCQTESEMIELSRALETAIRGVEIFSSRSGQDREVQTSTAMQALAASPHNSAFPATWLVSPVQ